MRPSATVILLRLELRLKGQQASWTKIRGASLREKNSEVSFIRSENASALRVGLSKFATKISVKSHNNNEQPEASSSTAQNNALIKLSGISIEEQILDLFPFVPTIRCAHPSYIARAIT